MSYSSDFSAQWSTLMTKVLKYIQHEMKIYNVVDHKKLSDYFKSLLYSWESTTEYEGIILDQIKNQSLKDELIKELNSLSIKKVKTDKEPNAGIGIVGTIILAIVGFIIFNIQGLNVFICLILCGGIIFGGLTANKRYIDNKRKEYTQKMMNRYRKQLKSFENKLIRVIEKYES